MIRELERHCYFKQVVRKGPSDKYLSRDLKQVRKLSTWITEGRAFQQGNSMY